MITTIIGTSLLALSVFLHFRRKHIPEVIGSFLPNTNERRRETQKAIEAQERAQSCVK